MILRLEIEKKDALGKKRDTMYGTLVFIRGIEYTVWKFQDFCITEILREINLWESRGAKSAIFTHLEDLNFDFYDFLHFLKAVIDQINLIHSL